MQLAGSARTAGPLWMTGLAFSWLTGLAVGRLVGLSITVVVEAIADIWEKRCGGLTNDLGTVGATSLFSWSLAEGRGQLAGFADLLKSFVDHTVTIVILSIASLRRRQSLILATAPKPIGLAEPHTSRASTDISGVRFSGIARLFLSWRRTALAFPNRQALVSGSQQGPVR